jgi:hypothetical protein
MQDSSSDSLNTDIVRLFIDDDWNIVFQISIWLVFIGILLTVIYIIIVRKHFRYDLVKVDIKLGNVGKAEFRPNKHDLQIAHKIWTELITRKAAIIIDKEHDIVSEVYDSWYKLFQRVRDFISDVPADMIRKNESTKEIIRIATQTLNEGLRPHLTKYQARFKTWSESKKDKLLDTTPQDLQKEYPEYSDLIDDMMAVNNQLIQYAQELKKIIDNK